MLAEGVRRAGDRLARAKVAAEMAISVLAYNLTRVMNIVGIKPLQQDLDRRMAEEAARIEELTVGGRAADTRTVSREDRANPRAKPEYRAAFARFLRGGVGVLAGEELRALTCMTNEAPRRHSLASKASALPTEPLIEKKQMPKSTKRKVPEKADDKEQSEAFIKAAQEAETNEDPESFDEAFRAVSKATKPDASRPRRSGKLSSA